MKTNKPLIYHVSFCLLFFILSSPAQAETKKENPKYEDKDIFVRVILRSPNQMQAFYEGREFPKEAVNEITKTCNIAIIIRNKTSDILWLMLDKWNFMSNNKPIARLDRSYWAEKWDKIKLSQAHRSTFGWTLMPEVRDLRADEGVGGGLTIPKQSKPVDIILNFPTGKNKNGPEKTVTIKNVSCGKNVDEK